MKMNRRKFVKTALVGIGAATLGTGAVSHLLNEHMHTASATHPGPHFDLNMVEAKVQMIDQLGRPENEFIYHFAYASGINDPVPVPQMPGPLIEVNHRDSVEIRIHNDLPEPHRFAIPGVVFDGGATFVEIPVHEIRTVTFTAAAGSYMYIDPGARPDLSPADPLYDHRSRVLGLHGPMIVRPPAPVAPNKITPYAAPVLSVQNLFNDLGGPVDAADLTRTTTGGVFPGDPWIESPLDAHARQRIWLFNEIDPKFNRGLEANLGRLAGARATLPDGTSIPITPGNFKANFLGRYFTINGEAGAYAANNHNKTMPQGNIGEPMLIRIMQAGMVAHSLHIHANHVYVLQLNNSFNVLLNGNGIPLVIDRSGIVPFVDTFTARPLDRIDWLLPFHRMPDLPGAKNIPVSGLIPQELNLVLGNVPQSPLAYPMHDHNEPTQTAAGGNYNQGQVVHFRFLGDLLPDPNNPGQNIKVPFPIPVVN